MEQSLMSKTMSHIPSVSDQCATLSNGVQIPKIGLGTSHKGGYSHDAVVYALQTVGYRLIDTASRYNNECKLRDAIKASGIPREELFLINKLWPAHSGYESTLAAFEQSCQNMETTYLDLYLIHWPEVPNAVTDKAQCRADTWRALEDLYFQGRCRAIGVSNFLQRHLEELMSNCRVKPHVNQMEYHPYQNPTHLRQYCIDHGIQLQGYSPLAKGTILSEAPLREIAAKYSKQPAQILLRWVLQNDVITIPKSTNFKRLEENADVFDFELSASDMSVLDSAGSAAVVGEGVEEGARRVVFRELIQDKLDRSYALAYPTARTCAPNVPSTCISVDSGMRTRRSVGLQSVTLH